MKKKLKSNTIMNELKGHSGFFQKQAAVVQSQQVFEGRTDESIDTVIPRHHDATIPCNHANITAIRKAVKEIGKEAATHRFTLSEKQAILAIIFHYKQIGISTSENEITRIAINYLITDFQKHQEASFLAEMLKVIHS